MARRSLWLGGVFDLIHVGHLHLLEYAASLEDLLVVAVLSDIYVRGYKSQDRPIIGQSQRAKMLASIRFVDFVYITNTSPNTQEALQLLQPSSIVFGEEGDAVRSARRIATVESASPHTKVHFLPRYNEERVSTGDIIRKIRGMLTFDKLLSSTDKKRVSKNIETGVVKLYLTPFNVSFLKREERDCFG
ncbi:MAG: D-glycero-beta-D-manno-heptose 1-phosphate adenylyltransferase [Patescibacteria group bacterium]|nr:D-glycero-beta-D-manno-heptose 1-phosphate adenylyltransferase [Patescibacteria group bacterium]